MNYRHNGLNPLTSRPPLIAIALLSATALGYEILLMRLFSIIQWHHFAYMIISFALLGYGASGTFLALAQSRLLAHYPLALLVNVALFALSAMPSFLFAQHAPFNPEEVLWDWHEPLWLMFIYVLLSLPFFFAANSVALTFARFRDAIARVYAMDLLGAGAGSASIVLLLYVFSPLNTLSLVSGLGLICVGIAAWELRLSGRRGIAATALVSAALVVWLGSGSELVISPYKSLSQTLRIGGAQIIAERHSPLGQLHVVENLNIPMRYAPGMSVNAVTEPPAQLAIFSDGDSMGVITRDTGDRKALAFLDQLTSALPYHLSSFRQVLVLGAGGGMDILQARYHGVEQIDAVELNPQVVELVNKDYSDFSGHLYSAPGVHVHTAEVRGFVTDQDQRYELIQLALLDSFGASSTGLHALSENYLYTIQGMQTYIEHLAPGGYLAISRWIKLPPRDTLKLFATAVEALQRSGIADAAKRLILIRGWQTSTLLVKNAEITQQEIDALRRFCRERAFDVAYYPGISERETNHYNILREPYFYTAARALLGEERESFMQRYKFNLRPATDDQPYFFNFFKWSVLPEILQMRGRGGMPLLETGYLVLVATLIQALVASVVLILLPLMFVKSAQPTGASGRIRLRVFTYFFIIGLAFLFLEIAFIQKFMLFLHHPLFAASVVLASFLVFAGLGSRWAHRFTEAGRYRRGAQWAVTGIVLVGGSYLFALDPLFSGLMAWPVLLKVAVSVALVSPLAFCMGVPFPLGLANLASNAVSLIPWAWGVNGCASVLSAVLATLLALHFGFRSVLLLALLLYVVALCSFPSIARKRQPRSSSG